MIIPIIMFIFSTLILFLYVFYVFFISLMPVYKRNRKNADSYIAKTYIMIPCLNEEKTIGMTLTSIIESKPDNTDIIVIDDDSSDNTVMIAKSFADKNVQIFQRKKPNAQQGKGASLNACYKSILKDAASLGLDSQNVLIGVFDADTLIDESYFDKVLSYFKDDRIGQVQSRVQMIKATSWLQKMQDFEFMLPITAIQNAREYSQSVCMGGNGQFMRLSALQSLEGEPWGNCLLEDFEIGLRLLLIGQKARFAKEAVVKQQAIKSPKRFIKQRSRWVQGNIQAISYFKDIIKSPVDILTKVDLIYFLFQSWINLIGIVFQVVGLFYLIFMLKILFEQSVWSSIDWSNEMMNLVILLMLYFVPSLALLFWHIKNSESKHSWKYLICAITMPIYNFLSFPSIIMAFWRQLRGNRGWIKTSRNV